MSRRDDERVADILDAASEIAEITELGREAWDKDRIRRLAAERLLEIIGEAANSLSEDFRTQHPGIPWRDIIGLRVVLAHHYHRVDPNQVSAVTLRSRRYRVSHPANRIVSSDNDTSTVEDMFDELVRRGGNPYEKWRPRSGQ